MVDPQQTERLPLLLHLHVPKTAGMALNDVIFAVYGHSGWIESDDKRLVNGVYYPHAGIERKFQPDKSLRDALFGRDVRAIVGHFSYGIHEIVQGPYEYVTILRHPIDRVVSLYYHIKTWDNTALHKEVAGRQLSLEQFVTELHYCEVDNGQTRRISGLDMPFGTCDQSMLKAAIHNLTKHIAVAGITERYVESVLVMKHTLGWAGLPALRPKNVNRARPQGDRIPERTHSLILERNRLDMELYRLAAERLRGQIEEAAPGYSVDLATLMR